MGKDKLAFSYHRDDGDYVVAINAADIKVTGNKLKEKLYRHHTHWAGGLKELTLAEMMQKDPRLVITRGVYGMLPKNKLRDIRITRLKVFVGADHPYTDKLNK
jgi:large subunit ribosomal protein L13